MTLIYSLILGPFPFFVKAGNFQKLICPCSVIKAQGLQNLDLPMALKLVTEDPERFWGNYLILPLGPAVTCS